MIDKTGESDTFAKFLSGSGSPEMKSDGVSERLALDERGACRRGVGVVGGTSSSLAYMRMTTRHMLDNSPLCLGNKQRGVCNEIVLQGV